MAEIINIHERRGTTVEADMPRQWIRQCREGMLECEANWMEQGKTFAWFNQTPGSDNGSLCWFWIDAPKEPCTRTFRFSMVGGGQIRTIEKWDWQQAPFDISEMPGGIWKDEDTVLVPVERYPRLEGTAHTAHGPMRFVETFDGYILGCSATAAIFGKEVPQEIADRVATTFAAIGRQQEVFCALLDGTIGCALCGLPLRDELSKQVAVDPDCAHKHGIPHSMQAASRRLDLRRTLLGEAESKN
jgi:hypothetical protein